MSVVFRAMIRAKKDDNSAAHLESSNADRIGRLLSSHTCICLRKQFQSHKRPSGEIFLYMVWVSTRRLFVFALDIESWKKKGDCISRMANAVSPELFWRKDDAHTQRHTASSPASQSSPHGAFMKLQPCRITVTLLVSHSWGFSNRECILCYNGNCIFLRIKKCQRRRLAIPSDKLHWPLNITLSSIQLSVFMITTVFILPSGVCSKWWNVVSDVT